VRSCCGAWHESRANSPPFRDGGEIDITAINVMRQLIVRNLDERIVHALQLRAAANQRSAEAEHREILRQALAPRRSTRTIKDVLRDMPSVGYDEDFERPHDVGRPSTS
jgi:antitoxin FitA